MANHAFVYGTQIPSNDEVNAAVEEIVRKFPMLKVEYEPETCWNEGVPGFWRVHCEDDDLHRVQFWRSKRFPCPQFFNVDTESWGDEEWEDWYSKVPQGIDCLEFRHGHGGELWWWLEFEIREELAARFNCTQEDEGVGGVLKNRAERFDTYAEYYSYQRSFLEPEKLKASWDIEIDMFERMYPESMHPLKGEIRLKDPEEI
jgi:hypothetical protein